MIWALLWTLGPGLAIYTFRRLIAVSWDDVNVYFKRRPSRYARALAHIKAMEIDCEIRDTAGDLVHPPRAYDSAGNPLYDYAANSVLRAHQRAAAEERRAQAEVKRKAEYMGSLDQRIFEPDVLVPMIGPARHVVPGDPPTVAEITRMSFEEYAQHRAALVGHRYGWSRREVPPIPTRYTYSTGPR